MESKHKLELGLGRCKKKQRGFSEQTHRLGRSCLNPSKTLSSHSKAPIQVRRSNSLPLSAFHTLYEEEKTRWLVFAARGSLQEIIAKCCCNPPSGMLLLVRAHSSVSSLGMALRKRSSKIDVFRQVQIFAVPEGSLSCLRGLTWKM